MLNDEQAHARHFDGARYCVLVDSPTEPTAILDVSRHGIGVEFLDEHLRSRLVYRFITSESGELFLRTILFRKFRGGSEEPAYVTAYIFDVGGEVTVRQERMLPTRHSRITQVAFALENNIEAYPAFGRYERLLNFSRRFAAVFGQAPESDNDADAGVLTRI
ncbi:MAG TPA: hypothetical protein VFM98_02600 [Ramlibacter sp.]|uniref:hypothetical protein n=1 Tax=Ramlibacter sp. TaxID=1917967 RepID=UPI002D7E53EB|nr:hypothetical protein [Ramlibacter sp.]HET8744466.1 hypothetical protein [Ramlibacter sp.]